MSVFISYSHSSGGEYATRIAQALRNVGVAPWWDADNIRHGASITREVEDGLRASDGAIIIFTHEYLESPGCFMELAYSLARLEVDKSFGIFVVAHDGDWSRVPPVQLRDIRLDDVGVTNFDGLAQEISRRMAPSPACVRQEGMRWPLAAAQFGFLPLRATLAAPVGQEQSFWNLHDALRARRIVQTAPAVHRPIVSVAGSEGAGCVELMATYVDLLGGSYDGGIVWLSERGTDEQIRGALRTIGQNLGMPPDKLEPDVLESSLCEALRARPPYLWIVLKGSTPRNRWRTFVEQAPTPNGQAVHLHESVDLMPQADVKLGPLSRRGVERIIGAAIGRQPEARTSAAVYEKTQGHLQAVMSAAKLFEPDGEKSALDELERMSLEETPLSGVSKAFGRLDRRKRDLLRAMCVLPDDVAVPVALVNAIYARSAIQTDDAIGPDDLSSLRSIGAIAPAFDRQSLHVTKTWRAASHGMTEVERESTVLTTGAAIDGSLLSELREPVVQALISVLPVNTRTRTEPNLSELELLGRHIVRIVTSKADCTLALRCAAVDALYGDHEMELDLVRRAHDWAGTTLGPDDPFTLEMAHELVECPAYPRDQARALMQQAFSSVNRPDADPQIMLPIAHAYAIEIGDENPSEALEILKRSYDPFKHRVDLDPMLHVRIRNSIGVFNREKNRADALAIWAEASEFAAAHGLGDTQEALRLLANSAFTLMQLGQCDKAWEIGRKVYESQLALWGSGHHLVLWATVDYLQYCLAFGRWE